MPAPSTRRSLQELQRSSSRSTGSPRGLQERERPRRRGRGDRVPRGLGSRSARREAAGPSALSRTCALRRGITTTRDLWDWWATRSSNGTVDRRNVAIILLDDSRKDVLRWFLRDAWIVKIEAPTWMRPATRSRAGYAAERSVRPDYFPAEATRGASPREVGRRHRSATIRSRSPGASRRAAAASRCRSAVRRRSSVVGTSMPTSAFGLEAVCQPARRSRQERSMSSVAIRPS